MVHSWGCAASAAQALPAPPGPGVSPQGFAEHSPLLLMHGEEPPQQG